MARTPFPVLPALGLFAFGHFALIAAVTGLAAVATAVPVNPAGAGEHTGALGAAPARGVLRPKAQAALATDLSARVAKVGFKEGEAFREGDVLIAFDCRRQEAELASAEAQEREMMVAYDSAAVLEKRAAGNRNDVEIAHARADKTHADAANIRAKVAQCVITAPYDGRVTALDIHPFEYPATGRPMLSIIAVGEPTIELIVPSAWLGWLKAGQTFEFLVDETGKTYLAEVVRLGATVDTVSQTVKVFGKFDGPSVGILPGMSGAAQFKRSEG